jgi:hypothetical protein
MSAGRLATNEASVLIDKPNMRQYFNTNSEILTFKLWAACSQQLLPVVHRKHHPFQTQVQEACIVDAATTKRTR